MLPEIESFVSWLRRKSPQSSTAVHYGSDLKLFFAWIGKPCLDVKVQDIDAYIEHCQKEGHAIGTVNRRLCALRSFYQFLYLHDEHAIGNPVIPKRHFIRPGERLPRDVEDKNIKALFEGITNVRDRAMFLLMLRCGLRVGEVRNLSMPDLYLEPASGSLAAYLAARQGQLSTRGLSFLAASGRFEVMARAKTQSPRRSRIRQSFWKAIERHGNSGPAGSYCHQAGLWVTCHQFRHTFGRHLTEARVPVTSIQRLFGHARLKSTEVYLHISDAQAQEDYLAAMNEIMRNLPLEVKP